MPSLTTPLPRTPPWARRNPFSSPASPRKPGLPPTPGVTPRALPPRPLPDCPRAHLPPLCHLGPRQQECTLPCPLGLPLRFLLLLLGLRALLPGLRIRLRGPSHQGSIPLPTCPSQNFQGHTVVRQSPQLPLPLLDRGGPCLLEGGALPWGVSTPLLVYHIRPQGHIPLLPRHLEPLPQCRGGQYRLDRGDLRHQPPFRHPPAPTRRLDCTQRLPILTKCHLRRLGPRPCPVDLTPTVELEAGNQSPSAPPTPTIYGHFKRHFYLVTFFGVSEEHARLLCGEGPLRVSRTLFCR